MSPNKKGQTEQGEQRGHNIRLMGKLLLPLVLIFLGFIGFARLVWLPAFLDSLANRALHDLHAHLQSVTEGLVPLLLENQLANIYESLDALLEENPDWQHLILTDTYGRRLYPLDAPSTEGYSNNIRVIKQEVGFTSPPLGTLELAVDFSPLYETTRSLQRQFIIAMMIFLAATIGVIGMLFELIVSRRLRALRYASEQLADGKYNTQLPADSRDEIGQLSASFATMRDALQAYHKQLMGEIDDHRRTAEALNLEKENATYDATHDPLTGLINRREFERRLVESLGEAKATKCQHALLYLDLDQFKVINDTCGHMAGDALLQQLNIKLCDYVRAQDTLARLGGDEFGMLLKYCTLEDSRKVADNLRKAVEDFRFAWNDDIFNISVSIGVAGIDQDSGDMANVLSSADSACYMAKERGRNRIQVYHKDDQLVRRREGEMQWVTRIIRSMHDDHFKLYCQPIYALDNLQGTPAHYEILLRLREEDGTITMPGAFIPAAERYNLITTLDRWVLTKLLDTLPTLESEQPLQLSINLSGPSLGDPDLLELLEQRYPEIVASGHKLCFEITETAAIRSLSTARHFMERLQNYDFMFSLDDFGTGMSSFSYLKTLPVDYLKIDGTFVRDIATDNIDYAMVRSINEIGQTMGMKTVAEFVESEKILTLLKGIGVDFAQGHYLGKATPLDGMFSVTRP